MKGLITVSPNGIQLKIILLRAVFFLLKCFENHQDNEQSKEFKEFISQENS